MKNIKIIISAILIIAFNIEDTTGQDTRSTQSFYSNPLSLNPAIMGMNTDFKAILNYRSQWKTIGGGYSNYSFTSLLPIYMKEGEQKLDLGLSVMNDQQGAYNSLKAGLAVGYNLQLQETGFLSFSVQGSFNQKSLDASGLTFDDQYVLGKYSADNVTNQTISNQSITYANMSFGLMWYYNPDREDSKLNAYLGVSGFNLIEPNQTYNTATDPLYRRVSLQGGIKILGDKKIDFMPNLIANVQNGSEEFMGGLVIDYNLNENSKVLFGAWYRKKDSYPIMLGVTMSGFSFKYSYDLTSSKLGSAIGGLATHELTLSYGLNMAAKKGGRSIPSMY